MKTPSATVLIVGNEVLSAKVRDENGPYAARALRERGVELTAVLTLPDRLEVLEEAVARERGRVDWLFTSGGVGPTHDDVTLLAVARALGRELARHPVLAENIRAWHRRRGKEAPEAALRMADVPEGTRLLGDPRHPVMVVENVVMLPGPPQFFRVQLDAFTVAIEAPPFRLECLFLDLGEEEFASLLERVAREHRAVDIGSYPRFDQADHRVKVTFESKDGLAVRAAVEAFLEVLPEGALVRREGP
ncbi:MAG TPA: competence/damage-inducible protein A [Anaeromyxobacteraceae bacterium]|nr:competence/damage-inducible protein A [Anaeromyxobacteraceae bacterium]